MRKLKRNPRKEEALNNLKERFKNAEEMVNLAKWIGRTIKSNEMVALHTTETFKVTDLETKDPRSLENITEISLIPQDDEMAPPRKKKSIHKFEEEELKFIVGSLNSQGIRTTIKFPE